MMRLMADQAWLVYRGPGSPYRARCLALRLSHHAITGAPYPGLYGSGYESLQPGTSGAPVPPLGEESFPPMGPPPLPVWEREYVDPLSALTESDWSSLPGSSATEADVWSVTSAAPPSEAEAPPGYPRSRRISKLNMIGLQASTHPR